jgi:hypothetical protein
MGTNCFICLNTVNVVLKGTLPRDFRRSIFFTNLGLKLFRIWISNHQDIRFESL